MARHKKQNYDEKSAHLLRVELVGARLQPNFGVGHALGAVNHVPVVVAALRKLHPLLRVPGRSKAGFALQ